VFRDLSHVEERDNGLVGGLDEQDLKGVPVEGDTLQSREHGVHGSAASDYKEMDQETIEALGLLGTYCYQSRSYRNRRRPCPRAS